MPMMSLKSKVIQDIVSPNGDKHQLNLSHFLPLVADKSVKDREKDQSFIMLLANTFKPSDIHWQDYDGSTYGWSWFVGFSR